MFDMTGEITANTNNQMIGAINSNNNNNDDNHVQVNPVTQVIHSMHLDYVHWVSFDTYGRRVATCSGDRFVRVWDLTESGGDWTAAAQWQAHRGAVTSLCWAHAEFGSLLATCGSDHEAKIWEERSLAAHTSSASSSNNHRWTLRASLTEARRGVTCLEFAPRHWGLKLAVGSADGCVRIYEAVDVMNLSQWPLAAALPSFDDGKSGGGAGGSSDTKGCTSLSWCHGRFEPPTLVAAGGGHLLIVYRYSESARAWQSLLQLTTTSSIPRNILHVAWAPNVGRRFHYIASAEQDQLRIYKLRREAVASDEAGNNNSGKHLKLESSQTLEANAWRCQWNVTGTVLASSGDAGVVQLWKPDTEGNFVCVSKVQGDLSQVPSTAAGSGK